MKNTFSKKSFLLLALLSMFMFSCKHDDQDPETDPNLIDSTHVTLENKYGIVATFPTGEWSNSYMDTFPTSKDAYYDEFRSQAIFTGRIADVVEKNGKKGYDSGMYFMHFWAAPNSEEEAEAFITKYRKYMFTELVGSYYANITEIEKVNVGAQEYEANYFEAERSTAGGGKEYVYIIFHNKELYGVNIWLKAGKEENLSEFQDILKTLKLD